VEFQKASAFVVAFLEAENGSEEKIGEKKVSRPTRNLNSELNY
jgi:hypothetical protein